MAKRTCTNGRAQTTSLGQLTGEKGFGFFPHSKQLMGQSTGDLENRRQKNSANLSELPRPVSLGWKSLGNRFCQESPVFSGSPSAQDTGSRKQPLGTSALGLTIVSRSWKKMGSKPRCFQTLRHIWFLLPWCGPAGSTQTPCPSHLSQQELSDVSLLGESISNTSDADLMSVQFFTTRKLLFKSVVVVQMILYLNTRSQLLDPKPRRHMT